MIDSCRSSSGEVNRVGQGDVRQARTAGIEALRYEWVRDRPHKRGYNHALLPCRAFVSREPVQPQTWRIHVGPRGVRALYEFPDLRLAFDRDAFADDPRIVSMQWER